MAVCEPEAPLHPETLQAISDYQALFLQAVHAPSGYE
jgi:hypothetical protein